MMLFPDHWANETVDFIVVPTPVGAICSYCDEPVHDGDRGVLMPHLDEDGTRVLPWHRRCLLRNILGDTVRCYECLDHGRVWIQGHEWAPCLCRARSAK